MIMRHSEWSYKSVVYELNIRQYTKEGTFVAAIERLEFLASLGIDIIWLMPIYPIGFTERKGDLGSYYAISDYCGVNSEFGTKADFDNFVAMAHALGMKVILDWVANHTARDARWIEEKPANWYERDAKGEAMVPWDWTDTAKLNYANHDVWQGQCDAMSYWVTQHDIDGFRCDMAMLVPIEFWNEVTKALRELKPDIFMLAEAEDANLFEGAFDACYGWELHHLMKDVAQQRCRVTRLRDFLYYNKEHYPCSAMRLMFTSNHDENSWGGSDQERFGDARELMSAFSFVALFGMPLIYTGQEIGVFRSFEFFDRDPIQEPYLANQTTAFYRKLIALKHSQAALMAGERGGDMIEIRNNAEDCLMTFVREVEGSRVVVIMNFSPYTIHADFNVGIYSGEYTDVMTGGHILFGEQIERDMQGWEYQILVK